MTIFICTPAHTVTGFHHELLTLPARMRVYYRWTPGVVLSLRLFHRHFPKLIRSRST